MLYKLSTLSQAVSMYHLLHYKKGGEYG